MCSWVRLSCHDALIQRRVPERCDYVFNESCITDPMISPLLATVNAKLLLNAGSDPPFIVGYYFHIAAELSCQQGYLLLCMSTPRRIIAASTN